MNVERAVGAATGLVATFGAPGIGGALLLNCMGLPFASELILPLAGVAVARGELGLLALVVWGVAGQVAGFVVAYWVARLAGIGLVERFGRYLFLSHGRVVAVQHRFQKHGSLLVFAGACLPWAHGSVGFSAGLAALPFAAFLACVSAGTVIYSAVLIMAGYWFGDALPRLVASSSGLVVTGLVAAALAAAAFWYSRHRFGVHPPTTRANPSRKRR